MSCSQWHIGVHQHHLIFKGHWRAPHETICLDKTFPLGHFMLHFIMFLTCQMTTKASNVFICDTQKWLKIGYLQRKNLTFCSKDTHSERQKPYHYFQPIRDRLTPSSIHQLGMESVSIDLIRQFGRNKERIAWDYSNRFGFIKLCYCNECIQQNLMLFLSSRTNFATTPYLQNMSKKLKLRAAFSRPQTKVRKGNVSSGVCLST